MSRRTRRLKTARRHRRSTAGKILPPLDVRSNKQLKEFERIIKQGGITFVLVWAPWCDHCHKFMPHFDAAAAAPNRSVQAIKVEESMLPAVNKILTSNINKSAAPLNVEGYPSIIVVDNKGNKVTDIEAVKDTETMKKAMENAGPLAITAGITSDRPINAGPINTRPINTPYTNINMGENELKGSINIANTKKNSVPSAAAASTTAPTKMKTMQTMQTMQTMPTSLKKLSQEAIDVTSLVTPITPPNPYNDTESIVNKKIGGGGNGSQAASNGGSLYASLLRASYTLAPTAALLASAAIVMRRTKRVKRAKRAKKTLRKTVKSRSSRSSRRSRSSRSSRRR